MLIAHALVVGVIGAFGLVYLLLMADPQAAEEIRRKARLVWRRWGLCAWRGRHEPVRVSLGLRCATCTRALADLGEAGLGDGYVSATRRIFSRANGGELVRTAAWEPTRRGW